MYYNKPQLNITLQDRLACSKNLRKIIYTHKYLERTKPNYLKPTVSSIMKRSSLYKENHTLLGLSRIYDETLELQQLVTSRRPFKPKARYSFTEEVDYDYYGHFY